MIGIRIKQLREKKGLTQKQLAAELSIHISALATYERETREPNIGLIKTFCAYFGVTSDYLLGLSDTPKAEHVDIVETTGLSSNAVRILAEISNSDKVICDTISALIENHEREALEGLDKLGEQLLNNLSQYLFYEYQFVQPFDKDLLNHDTDALMKYAEQHELPFVEVVGSHNNGEAVTFKLSHSVLDTHLLDNIRYLLGQLKHKMHLDKYAEDMDALWEIEKKRLEEE